MKTPIASGLRKHVFSAWNIECARCANDDTSFYDNLDEALNDFESAGWALVDDRPFCPGCADYLNMNGGINP